MATVKAVGREGDQDLRTSAATSPVGMNATTPDNAGLTIRYGAEGKRPTVGNSTALAVPRSTHE